MGLKVIEWVNERVGVGKSYRATRFARRNERELAVGLGFNIRDLGGYRAGKARFVRSHRFLRAGDTSFLDAEGISILRGYGVSRVLDLRGKLERPELTDVFAKQVGRLFGKELLDRASRMAGSEERLRALHRAVVSVDAGAVQNALRRILLDSPSYHDLTSEGDYHVLLLALLYAAPGYRPATSNRESGDGRADVLLEPLPSEAGCLSAHAMELKLTRDAKDEDALVTCARDVALAQAERLEYGHGLAGSGLVRWGIAFSGKHVACVCERLDL